MKKEKIKFDRYLVTKKGKTYEILKFPRIRYMWAYDAHPGEELLMVDGSREAIEWLLLACAIMADYKDKIIYFPIRKPWTECGTWDYGFDDSYDLVLCRFGFPFQRSLWTKIKGRLDQKHSAGKFVLHYDRKKLDDYLDKGLWTKYDLDGRPKQRKKGKSLGQQSWEASQRMIQEIQGDTIFWVYDRILWYELHSVLAYDLDHLDDSRMYSDSYLYGWIVPDRRLKEMYE